MPLGGLVSYGGSSDEDSDTEDQITEQPVVSKPSNSADILSGEISDEEEIIGSSAFLEATDEDLDNIPGLSSSKSLFDSLPSISKTRNEEAASETSKNFVDENEDLSTIPKAKVYSEAPDLKAMKPKKKGPIRIMAPSLITETDEEEKRPFVRPSSSSNKTKSGLLSLLPAPKNSFTVISKPTSTTTEAAKPSQPSKPAFVPRSVTKKPVKKQVENGSDDEEESADVPFFTMDSASQQKSDQASSSGSIQVKANPDAFHPRGITKGSHPSHQFMYNEDQEEYSSVTAPYPPPMPSSSSASYDPSAEALERLAGKAGKRRKGEAEPQIIDVNFEDIKPDEREWLTKALTEDEADKPGPRNTIKGERKRKHQITYLAAMAKEREHELKKQWSESAHNRRAAASKYGF